MFTFQTTKFFPLDSESLFKFFSQKELLEKWCAPVGMTLDIPIFDFGVGGLYRYEHKNELGTYSCNGIFTDITSAKIIVQKDKEILGPEGQILMKDIESKIEFQENLAGTEVYITQVGFKDEKTLLECEVGWNQCLEKLQGLVLQGPNVNTGKVIDQEARLF